MFRHWIEGKQIPYATHCTCKKEGQDPPPPNPDLNAPWIFGSGALIDHFFVNLHVKIMSFHLQFCSLFDCMISAIVKCETYVYGGRQVNMMLMTSTSDYSLYGHNLCIIPLIAILKVL